MTACFALSDFERGRLVLLLFVSMLQAPRIAASPARRQQCRDRSRDRGRLGTSRANHGNTYYLTRQQLFAGSSTSMPSASIQYALVTLARICEAYCIPVGDSGRRDARVRVVRVPAGNLSLNFGHHGCPPPSKVSNFKLTFRATLDSREDRTRHDVPLDVAPPSPRRCMQLLIYQYRCDGASKWCAPAARRRASGQ